LRWVGLGWVSRLVGSVELKKLDPWTTLISVRGGRLLTTEVCDVWPVRR